MTQKGKIALITGATAGLGLAVAKKYIDLDIHVIAVGRNMSALEELEEYTSKQEKNITLVQLDITDYPKISELGQKIGEKFGHLDVFVSCAAILGELTPLDHYNYKIWDKVIATNLTANWHLIKTFTPLLKLSKDGGQAIFTTCKEAISTAYWGAYSVSKAGLENLVAIYQAENKKTNLQINLIDPGKIATKLREAIMPGSKAENWPQPEEAANLFVEILRK